MVYSISCTTRDPREGEVDGESYHFLSDEAFNARKEAGDFVEHATVHGNQYGTLRETLTDTLNAGKDVLMDIDVQGATQLRERIAGADKDDPLRRAYVDIFIAPPSLVALRERLEKRGQDSAETIDRRLDQADDEMSHWSEYDYLLVNEEIEASYEVLRSIVIAERHKLGHASHVA